MLGSDGRKLVDDDQPPQLPVLEIRGQCHEVDHQGRGEKPRGHRVAVGIEVYVDDVPALESGLQIQLRAVTKRWIEQLTQLTLGENGESDRRTGQPITENRPRAGWSMS